MSETEPTREQLVDEIAQLDRLLLCRWEGEERQQARFAEKRTVYRLALEAIDRRAELATLTAQVAEQQRTITSVATMLGWGNVPPRETIEADIRALNARVADLNRRNDALYTVMPCGHQQQYAIAARCLLCQVAEQAQEIAAKETMIAATDAEAVKALLLLTDAEAKLHEQAQEIERLRREWEDAVERERRLAPSLADTQVMARDAQAKLRAVEALRDEALGYVQNEQLGESRRNVARLFAIKLTAILTPEAQ